MVHIGIVDIDSAHTNGIVSVWWNRSDGKPNEEWESREPIWNILTAFQVYQLLKDQETHINYHVLTDNFSKVQPYPRTIHNFFDDLDEYLESFQCKECSSYEQKDFGYNRTVANGEVWVCKNCKEELLVNEEPNEDNY
jgi:predicted SprT family Zn-dependent metalloprotease